MIPRPALPRAHRSPDAEATPRETVPLGLRDAGLWQRGIYAAGEGVTYGGQFWVARRATEATPGQSGDWRLAVRRGRDGKEGPPGPPPDHRWTGTKLQIEKPDGTWGEAVDLQGPKGDPGRPGAGGVFVQQVGGGGGSGYFPGGW